MAKDTTKISDDNIKAQWSKNNASHDALWKVVVRIAEEYGLGFDENGEVIFEENADNKAKSDAPTTAPTSIDATKLIAEIKTAISTIGVNIENPKMKIEISDQIHVKNNNEIFQAVTEKWDKWLKRFIQEYLKAHGVVKDICIEDEHVYKIEPLSPKVKPTTYTPPKKPSVFTKFRHELWEDVVSSFWKRLAYFALFCCACFGFYQWYYNQKMKAIVKEYVIVRSLLENDPTYQRKLKGIDSFIQADGLDEIYKYVEEQKNGENK